MRGKWLIWSSSSYDVFIQCVRQLDPYLILILSLNQSCCYVPKHYKGNFLRTKHRILWHLLWGVPDEDQKRATALAVVPTVAWTHVAQFDTWSATYLGCIPKEVTPPCDTSVFLSYRGEHCLNDEHEDKLVKDMFSTVLSIWYF